MDGARGSLARILGLGFGIAVIFGGTVGVGILRLPGEIAGRLGSAWLIMLVWLLGGAYALLGAISLSELGAALPQAGGFYVYAKRAYGPAAGFVMGWADWLCNCSALSFVSVAASEYLLALVPGFQAQSRLIQTALALALLALFCCLHWFGLRLSSGVQKLTSSVTAVTFVALAVACLLHTRVAAAPVIAMPRHGSILVIFAAIVSALPAIVVAYDGWYEAIYFTEEGTDPARQLPRAMIGGVLLIIGLYLLLNLAFVHVLSIPAMAASKLVAADAARIVFPAMSGMGDWSGIFITVLSLLTLLSTLNALLLGAPRILFAVGRDGLFRGVGKVDAAGTPKAALLATAAMTAMIVASGRFDDIIAVGALMVAATYTVNYVALIVLRVREPGLARPFRAWGYPVSTLLVLIGSLAFVVLDVRADPGNSVRAVVLLGAALPVYAWSRWKMKAKGHGDGK